MNTQLQVQAKATSQLSITPTQHGLLQRTCDCGQHAGGGECAECKKKNGGTLQRASVATSPGIAVLPVVHDVLNSPGQTLDTGTRAFMEPRFSHDFSSVRVHTDSRAADSARSVNALAYTVGRNVVFGAGQYQPGTIAGQRLLAHELTHVVQQNKGTGWQKPPELLEMTLPGDATEQEAEHVSNAVMNAQSFTPIARTIDTVAMQKQDAGAVSPDISQSGQSSQSSQLGAKDAGAGVPEGDTGQAPAVGSGADAGTADGDAGQPQPALPAQQQATCVPKALSRKDYLATSGTTENDFGLTSLSGNVVYPVLHVTPARGGVKVDPTDAQLAPITSVYTGAGTFTEGKNIFVARTENADCATGKYDVRWRITQDGADTIAKGEKEHCDDFFYAFNTTIRLYADTVNQLSMSNRVFKNQREVENIVTKKVGVAPGKWQSMFNCLIAKTKLRDQAKWHTPRPFTIDPSYNNNCAYILKTVSKSSFAEIGKHPPSEILKDCGK
ncbi:MAG TPA: DUF4157 domain-containing protein [Ktedonobacteraceae bacterium]|nr:DUF4157 domain-containing protein [Ktedonobacteraceae bacterium]